MYYLYLFHYLYFVYDYNNTKFYKPLVCKITFAEEPTYNRRTDQGDYKGF